MPLDNIPDDWLFLKYNILAEKGKTVACFSG